MNLARAPRSALWVLAGLVLGGPVDAASRTFRVRHRFGDLPLPLGELSLTNAAGNVLSVTRLDYLLSQFRVVTPDGNETALGDQVAYLSAGAGRESFELNGVPEGRIGAVRFRVGLTPDRNHADLASLSPSDPLNPTINGLHWGWQGGYVFLALEGNWRRADGASDGYSLHLATDALELPVEVGSVAGSPDSGEVSLELDVARIFSAIAPIRLEESGNSTHSRSNDPLALVIGRNLGQSFRAAALEPAVPDQPTTPPLRIEMAPGARPYRFPVPARFPLPALPRDNPLTEEGVALGRRLFHDASLSVNGRQSCASCHQEDAAFVDAGRRFSLGAEGGTGTRNAMPLANLAWVSTFFWDGRAGSLREQVLMPVQDPLEMHETLTNVVAKLSRSDLSPAFQAAFGSAEVTADRVARALEQYLFTLVSGDSRFDRAMRGGPALSVEEQRGFELFHTEHDPRRGQFGADCFHCHGGALFSDQAYHNNGLDLPATTLDAGRSAVTGKVSDFGKFKTPSLRNVALTAPYMHDGRFRTLEQVVAHYCSGVKRSSTLDPNLAKHPDSGVALGPDDQKALVAFLKTLTDERFAR